MAAPVPDRARASSAENNPPRNPRRVGTTYPFRMTDMACSSIDTSLHTDPPKEARGAGTWHDAHGKSGARHGFCKLYTAQNLAPRKKPTPAGLDFSAGGGGVRNEPNVHTPIDGTSG